MKYFDLQNKQDFINNVGSKYDTNNSGTEWYFDTRSKLQHLITLLAAKLNKKLVNNYNEKPNGQAGQGQGFKLKFYVLTGFIEAKHYSKMQKQCFIKLQFFERDGDLYFSTEIDVNFSDTKNKHNDKRDMLMGKTSESWLVDNSFPNDWDELLKLILPRVKANVEYLETYINQKTSTVIPSNSDLKLIDMSKPNSLNQILFGAPGTGKTFNTINRALEITGKKLEAIERPEVKKMFDEKLELGQIVFTTFHQNMSYEDFIEGIKPKEVNGGVIYRTEEGIFKAIARKAFNNILSKNAVIPALTFDTLHQEFLKEIEPYKGTEDYIFSTLQGSKLKYVDLKGSSIKVKFRYKNAKSQVAATEEFTITKDKLKQLFEAGVDPDIDTTLRETFRPFFKHNLSVYYAVYKKFYKFAKEHYNVEEIEDINDDRSFKELKAEWDSIDQSQRDNLLRDADNFVIIIDEINRGNVSKIFGELITLIEDSKRLGKPEAITATLPYSKDEFSVPPNLYIIGTMNTADRSVEALDTALRRRFDFEEFPPQPELLNGYVRAFGYEVKEILITLNKRIEVLLNKDNLIGHSFFMVGEKDQTNTNEVERKVVNAFHKNIIPLLQEYFYSDYNKIGLVLGSKFVSKKIIEKVATLFANDKEFGGSDYIGDNFTYCIEDITKANFGFQEAIDVLMNKVSTVTVDEA